MRGISVWLFSKIIMLLFVFLAFALMTSFYVSVKEKEFTDSAYFFTEQLKERIQMIAFADVLESQTQFYLPKTLPEERQEKGRFYTLTIGKKEDVFYILLSWGTEKSPKKYLVAQGFNISKEYKVNKQDSCKITVQSSEYIWLNISKKEKELTIQKCKSSTSCDQPKCEGS
ncbi:MAG: hypothetical protein QW735_00865 [archaeon]